MSSCAADPRGAHGVNEQGAGGSDRRDGMGWREEGAGVVEAWFQGVSMVGLPRNPKLEPEAGKPSSKTNWARPSAAASPGPKDYHLQPATAADGKTWAAVPISPDSSPQLITVHFQTASFFSCSPS
ncbi:hypothetical protein ILYODFUR_018510 [Ilyodon furcidens]|uniref:Uncharacterized protein n=1 Tax=Ilyodon furcidens TaxID=33524 RepID=A0ABV0VHT5_9TELE